MLRVLTADNAMQNIEPTFLRKRKLLELVLARKGPDQDVINSKSSYIYYLVRTMLTCAISHSLQGLDNRRRV